MSHQQAIAENGSQRENTIDVTRTFTHRNVLVAGQYLHGRLTMREQIEQRGFNRAHNGRVDMWRTGFPWRPAFPATPRGNNRLTDLHFSIGKGVISFRIAAHKKSIRCAVELPLPLPIGRSMPRSRMRSSRSSIVLRRTSMGWAEFKDYPRKTMPAGRWAEVERTARRLNASACITQGEFR